MSQSEFKKRELERLLSEDKITLDEYLTARAKLENLPNNFKNLESDLPENRDISFERRLPPAKKHNFSKVAVAVILSTIILISAFVVWSFTNPANAENLEIEGYNLDLLPISGRISFQMRNSGSTNISISKITMNGYSNQSVSGLADSNIGWTGSLYLEPDEKGTIYVYVPCYFDTVLSAMLPSSSSPTQEEIDIFNSTMNSYMNSYVCTFKFVTAAQREYTCEVPDLASSIFNLGSQSIGFMSTELLQIRNVHFSMDGSTPKINIAVSNPSVSDVILAEIYLNNEKAEAVSPALPETIEAGSEKSLTVTFMWVPGGNYQIKLISSKGNPFVYTAAAPS